jgi:hypothetical protein
MHDENPLHPYLDYEEVEAEDDLYLSPHKPLIPHEALYFAVHPRSIGRATPVIAEASSEQRYCTNEAISPGSTSLLIAAGSSIILPTTS